jgi:hypothetical protein
MAAHSLSSATAKLSTTLLIVAFPSWPAPRTRSYSQGAVGSALDQVTLRAIRNEEILDRCSANIDALHFLDDSAGRPPAARYADLIVVAQACDPFAFKFPPRLHVDIVVDRLVGRSFLRIVGQKRLHFERKLLWRPEHF